ncbi:ABC transporter ATP-binding protein [Sneathiella litorea]|uniref:ATP-binding cassette domain-containing protein n=1 Tax=Sneathiella litorea TaxID=2606216 RepID=A0A6L8WAF1_9PROT|nr:ATP-binding cassette domain-containing protein [Sneathiella litorea]MZR31624.1 ATP-binding cassette domain-containing protein [Sneathiella litorea]
MIKISDLTVHFGGVVALDNITVDIQDDIVGVIGPNGAGKTTLINVLSGFVLPDSGAIDVEGVDLLSLAPHRRARWGLARSFQKVQTADNLSVADNIWVSLDTSASIGMRKSAALNRVLEYVGLVDMANVPAAMLNPCQRRMTELARCLVASPRIVLLDEPGGGLSECEVDRLRYVIGNIKANFGAQVLLIDHDVELIRSVCSKTMVLDFGEIIAYGPTETVLQDENVKAAYLGTEIGT